MARSFETRFILTCSFTKSMRQPHKVLPPLKVINSINSNICLTVCHFGRGRTLLQYNIIADSLNANGQVLGTTNINSSLL